MARPGRQLAQLQGAQFAAQRLLADRNAEFVEHPLRQVDQPPAHDAVNRRDRAALDDLQQRLPVRLPVRLAEQRGVAGRLAVHQPRRSLGVEGQHPVPHRLQPNPADPSGIAAGAPVINRRQHKSPPAPATAASDWHPPTASPARAIARRHNPREPQSQPPWQTPIRSPR